MLSLFTSISAIVFLILLTVTTLYHGGTAFTQSKNQAEATTLINQSQSIAAAIVGYSADSPLTQLDSPADLVPQYISSIPDGWEMFSSPFIGRSGFVVFPIANDDEKNQKICEEANAKLGIPLPVPECSSVSEKFVGCCTSNS